MKSFEGKIAVVTGGGSGMGRELALQLVAMGCDVAMCDVSSEGMAETKRLCLSQARQGTRVATSPADVSIEEQVLAFAHAVRRDLDTEHIHFLFNNAGIGGGGLCRRRPRRMGKDLWRLLVRRLLLHAR